MRLKALVVWLSISIAAFGLAACGDDDAATDGGTDSGTDTDTDTDADGSLTVLVLSESWTADPAPAEGALVTLDKPGGERVELTTGADGTVVFEGLDWSLGAAAATASMDGHGMATHVGLTEADSPLTIRIPVQPVETVTLSGTLTNMMDESNILDFYVIANGGGRGEGTAPDYSIEVPAGVPFGLSGIECTWETPSDQGSAFVTYNWYWQEMDAITADTTSDLTFEGDGGVETTEVSGSFDYSLTEGTPLSGTEGRGLIWVSVEWENYRSWSDWGWWNVNSLGWARSVDVNADGTAFDFTVEYMQPSSIEQYVTFYAIDSISGEFTRTEVIEEGLPTAGSNAIEFVDVPVLPSAGPFELNGTPFTWESAETDVRPTLVLAVGNNEHTWIIEGPVGATSLAVPAPPEGATLTAQIETGMSLAKLVLSCDAADSTPALWRGARSYSEEFAVTYTP